MDEKLNAMQQSKLLNRLVINRQTAEEMGRVERFWLDTQNHQVRGFVCKSGGLLGSNKQTFTWTRIAAIGDSIMVDLPPEEDDAPISDKLETVIGHELWTDAGNKVGKLVDFLVDLKTGTIVNYIFASSGWMGVVDGTYLLSPDVISSIGSKRAIVSDARIKESDKFSEGVGKKISQAGGFLQEDAKQTHQDLKVMQGGFKAAFSQAKMVAEQLKEKVEDVTERAKLQEKKSSQPSRNPRVIEVEAETVIEPPQASLEASKPPSSELELPEK